MHFFQSTGLLIARVQLAIEYGFGGPDSQEKGDWLQEVIVEQFEKCECEELPELG